MLTTPVTAADLPPLNSLRAFDAAGRRLSFRAAADELGVTQGAVAQHVRQLEAHLDVTLFERVPKGLAFTSPGRSYHARIAEAFAELRAATVALRPEQDKVVISVTPTFAAKWLIPNLPDFAEIHPDIDLRIMATEKVSSFHSDGIDLAVRQGTPPFGASLHATRLFKQEVIAVADLLHHRFFGEADVGGVLAPRVEPAALRRADDDGRRHGRADLTALGR